MPPLKVPVTRVHPPIRPTHLFAAAGGGTPHCTLPEPDHQRHHQKKTKHACTNCCRVRCIGPSELGPQEIGPPAICFGRTTPKKQKGSADMQLWKYHVGWVAAWVLPWVRVLGILRVSVSRHPRSPIPTLKNLFFLKGLKVPKITCAEWRCASSAEPMGKGV